MDKKSKRAIRAILEDLEERQDFCIEMSNQCHAACEHDIANEWAVKSSEVAKAIETIKKYTSE